MEIQKYIDHTLLKPNATPAEIEKLCQEAQDYGFFSVCVNSGYVKLAAEYNYGTPVATCSVVGFPLGAMDTASKVYEAEQAILNGASEIDMVLNIGLLVAGNTTQVEEDIRRVKSAIGQKVLKVILETCLLTQEQKITACKLCLNAGADFVKTSTGFSTGGATFDDVILMKSIVGNQAKVKASGGIRDRQTALRYIDLGVERIGTSNGIAIVQGSTATNNY